MKFIEVFVLNDRKIWENQKNNLTNLSLVNETVLKYFQNDELFV